MKQLEIILLRLPGEAAESLSRRIRKSIGQGPEQKTPEQKTADRKTPHQKTEVTLYRRRGLDTDLAVHVHSAGLSPTELSDLALQIASELKAWGLVDHSSWEEMERPRPLSRAENAKAMLDRLTPPSEQP